MRLCFATNNHHKLSEVQQLIGDEFEIVSLGEIGHHADIPEDHDTMEDNSLQKARFIHDKYGVDCFADDSGLEVEALNGEPGVFSARYAGPQRNHHDNNEKLLVELEGNDNRKAQFRAVISLLINGEVRQFEGVVKGEITRNEIGSGGFGYDPVFVPEGHEVTFAEMDDHLKNKLSHRGKAVKKLVEYLKSMPHE